MKTILQCVLPALLLLLSVVPSASRSQAIPLHSFQGRFVFTGDGAEVRSMEQSINRVVDQFNIFVREIARGEIHRAIDPEPRIEVSVENEALSLRLGDWGPIRLPLDGRARQVRGPDGSPTRASATFDEGRLIQRQVAPRGSRVNVFTLGADQETLHMHVRIASDQLPDDIRYRLSYRRAQ